MTTPEAHVDADFFKGLRLFANAADEANVPWLVVGATARILLLERVYDWPVGLATQDTDFAVQVGSWDHFEALGEALMRQPGIEATKRPIKRFSLGQDLKFDLLPYGGIEENERQVFWPPDRDYLMTVRGFSGAARNAVTIRVNDSLDVPVVSPPGLCALKLFAWQERHAQEVGRDARDIAYLFEHIEHWLPTKQLYDLALSELEEADYQPKLAALDVFGQEVIALLDQDERRFLREFVMHDVEQRSDGRLIRELTRYTRSDDPEKAADMLSAFLGGLNRELYC